MTPTPFMDFGGQRILVTGATSGIGEAIADELCRRNAMVVLVGRNQEKLDQTGARLGEGRHESLCLDLAELDAIVPRIKTLAAERGRIYGLCHAAGVVETRPLNTFKRTSFEAMLDVNFTAGIEMARAVTRRDVIVPEGGSVLFISSIYSRIGMPGQIGYSATKGAIQAAARAMSMELARRGIRVNTLSPGMVRTPMTDIALGKLPESHVDQLQQAHPLGFGTPADVARAAAFLLDPANTWMTGTELVIDGGYTAR